MSTFPLTISSPSGDLFSGEVMGLTLRGAEGDLAILAGHIPFMTTVKPGKVCLHFLDGTKRTGKTDGGLLTVSQERTTLLSGSFAFEE